MPQNKVPGEDLWDHTLRAVDGAVSEPTRIRMAALLHDIGKPSTMADGRFLGHEIVGAEQADEVLDRWRWPTTERERVVHLIRNHMFGYVPTWSDAADPSVHREGRAEERSTTCSSCARRTTSGPATRRTPAVSPSSRAASRRSWPPASALDLKGLAIDGSDLMAEFGWTPGPIVGRTLQRLLDRVIADPTLNTRDRLLAVARSMAAQDPGR